MVKNGTCVDKIRRRILASNRANPTTKKHSPHDGSNPDARINENSLLLRFSF